jgi:hypothetical protein
MMERAISPAHRAADVCGLLARPDLGAQARRDFLPKNSNAKKMYRTLGSLGPVRGFASAPPKATNCDSVTSIEARFC